MDDDLDYLDDLDAEPGAGAGSGGSDGWFGPLEAGAAFALAGHLADRHAEKVTRGHRHSHDDQRIEVHVHPEEERSPTLINAAEGKGTAEWSTFFGQEPMKKQIRIHIESAKRRDAALDHVLLASGMAGAGKTTLARIIAAEMGGELIMLVPPFHVDTLNKAAMGLPDKGVLFIDEVHKLADHGKAAAENLLHMLEERRLYLDSGVVELNDITVIGATTDADKLPETIIDRFPIKPFFQPYSVAELAEITGRFQGLMDPHGKMHLPLEVTIGIAMACRGTPRVARELVVAARDITHATGREPTIEQLLAFKETDPDGMTRQHKAYVIALYTHFRRRMADGTVLFVAGEYAMRSILRETRDGLYRLERFLMQRGYLDRSPQGRRLTDEGIIAAEEYIAEEERRGAA